MGLTQEDLRKIEKGFWTPARVLGRIMGVGGTPQPSELVFRPMIPPLESIHEGLGSQFVSMR